MCAGQRKFSALFYSLITQTETMKNQTTIAVIIANAIKNRKNESITNAIQKAGYTVISIRK